MFNELIEKEFRQIILKNSVMWVNILDSDANVIIWNKAAEKISGYSKEEVLGNKIIWESLYPDEEYRISIYNKALEIIANGEEITDFETTITCKDGSEKIISWNTHNIEADGSVVGSIAIGVDVTKIKNSENELKLLTLELEKSNKKLHELSYIDSLTHIPNRRAYEERISNEIQATRRSGEEFSLLMIDVDRFKEYNDTYGHEKGDEVLSKVSHHISKCLPRKTDFIARYGGEEIVAILSYTPLDKAEIVAEKILQCIQDLKIPHSSSVYNQLLTVSIGIASTETGIGNILDHADKALYDAKNNGRNRFNVYT
ncbi:diguanylate cyclase domain-containing protein [Campylobacterota bacterium]